MRIEYRFAVKGTLNFPDELMFEFKQRCYEFESNETGLTCLKVSVKGDSTSETPIIIQRPDTTPHITIRDGNYLPFIQMELRNLEGLLAPYGIHEIDINNPKISWIAETEEEKNDIKMHSWEVSKGNTRSVPLPPDLMARAIMASFSAGSEVEIPLIFYRKAFVSYVQERYYESCIDYFFLLETLYADGKFREKEVKKNFKNSTELQAAIKAALQENFCLSELRKVSQKKFEELILNKSTEEISDFLVKFRGHIHHHSIKDKNRWHPARQKDAEFEATLFTHICYEIAIKIITDQLFAEDILLKEIKTFQKIAGRSNKGAQK